jgi:hypothetical protein
VEVDSKKDALYILPPVYRPQAKVVQLNKFSLKEIEEILEHHETPV